MLQLDKGTSQCVTNAEVTISPIWLRHSRCSDRFAMAHSHNDMMADRYWTEWTQAATAMLQQTRREENDNYTRAWADKTRPAHCDKSRHNRAA